MLSLVLFAGLLLSGLLGFLLGARPEILFRIRSGERAQAAVELLYPLAAAFFAGYVFSTLVPEALMHSRGTLAAFLLGAAGMGILSRYLLKRDPCCEGGHDHRGLSLVSLVAMSICSVNDGMLLGLLQPAWHSGLNLGMILHKVTSSFAIAQVLVRSGHRGLGLAVFGVGYILVSPAAYAATGLPVLRDIPGGDLVAGFGAGVLAYAATAGLAPHAGAILRRRPKALFGAVAALLLSIGIGFWHRSLHSHAGPGAGRGHGAVGAPEHAGHGHAPRLPAASIPETPFPATGLPAATTGGGAGHPGVGAP
jgi:hypothetical protein